MAASARAIRFLVLCFSLGAAAVLGACSQAPLRRESRPARAPYELAQYAEPVAGSEPAPPAESWEKFNGRKKYVGNGHCVALVQAAVPEVGHTGTWVRGQRVYGHESLAPGTPIATFEPSGTYGNYRRGRSHAALYLGQDEAGIYVLDQWRPTRKSRGQKPRERFIPWVGEGDTLPANAGEWYYVVNVRAPGPGPSMENFLAEENAD